jgi:hypothetical protein
MHFRDRETTIGEEGRMRKSEQCELWVVYKMAVHKKPDGMNAVCEQSEWDAMERDQPGQHTLIRAGIANEAEAELLARGTSGDAKATLHQQRLWEEETAALGAVAEDHRRLASAPQETRKTHDAEEDPCREADGTAIPAGDPGGSG